MTKKIDRVGAALLIVALLVVAGIILKIQRDEANESRLVAERQHIQHVLDVSRDTLSALKDVENGQRAYLLTGDRRYLEPYNTGLNLVHQGLSNLSELVSDQQDASLVVGSLSNAVDAKMDELRATIQMHSAGKHAGAVERVLRGEGLEYMQEAMGLSEHLIQLERGRLQGIEANLSQARREGNRTVLPGCGVLSLLVAAGTLLLAREASREKALVARLEESYERYRGLAENLEDQVHARTQELSALNSELEAFSYSVSHDLRAPLRSIDGFSLILLEDHVHSLDEEARNSLMRIRAATARMGQLIKSLLELSRVNRVELNREQISITEMAKGIIEGFRLGEPDRDVEVHIDENLRADGDPELVRIVLENLLSNAWKFSAKRPNAMIQCTGEYLNNRTVICISDNGAGFNPAFSDRLYTPFQRLHSAADFDGIGIGLATVKRVVHRHGGELWAESRVGEGAKFYFSL